MTNTPIPADAAKPLLAPPSAPTGDALRAWLRVANLQFSARLLTALLECFDNDPQAALEATDESLDAIPAMQPRHRERLRAPAFAPTDRQIAWVEKYDARLILRGQPEYPQPLLDIYDPPPLLFARGALAERDRISVGIVGSRAATPYGRATAERLARELAGHGLTVVSGGALGIDTAAHRGALAGGGRTLAFLGCGLDVDYPRANRALFDEIVKNGALLSEYPLGAQPEAWRFPGRNRLISGMTLGTLVVEAPRQSGALITAARAVEQGRSVLAVPGNIDRPSSAGSNDLLKEGAVPVTETEDILRAFRMVVVPARRGDQRALDLSGEGADGAGEAAGDGRQRGAVPPALLDISANLPEKQKRLLGCLSLTPMHMDMLAEQAGMSVMETGVELTLMELNGLVRRLPGNTYIRLL